MSQRDSVKQLICRLHAKETSRGRVAGTVDGVEGREVGGPLVWRELQGPRK